jgi:hypothetical protein
MSREIKFRVWDTRQHVMRSGDAFNLSLDGDVYFNLLGGVSKMDANCRDQVVEQWTGLNDRNDTPIYEGDIILIGPANFESILLNPEEVAAGGIPIYEEHTDKPLPAPDVVYAKAAVRWDQSMCEYRYDYLWLCDEWAKYPRPASGKLGLGLYTLEVVGNIHEQEQFAGKQESAE